jgi:recombinational DNA repair protein (RecF pathway)
MLFLLDLQKQIYWVSENFTLQILSNFGSELDLPVCNSTGQTATEKWPRRTENIHQNKDHWLVSQRPPIFTCFILNIERF